MTSKAKAHIEDTLSRLDQKLTDKMEPFCTSKIVRKIPGLRVFYQNWLVIKEKEELTRIINELPEANQIKIQANHLKQQDKLLTWRLIEFAVIVAIIITAIDIPIAYHCTH